MKRSHILITVLLAVVATVAGALAQFTNVWGGVPWAGWGVLFVLIGFVGLVKIGVDTSKSKQDLTKALSQPPKPVEKHEDVPAMPTTHADPDGPSYPHPVINVQTCIGCHACVDACPHDVLAIVNGKSTPVAVEQCMEDTSCQVECPTVPKSCIVVNTSKKIPARKVPKRDGKFMTNVQGVYLIGDVSGVPLIKNAINEGGGVIDSIVEDLKSAGQRGADELDLAIVGIGPAGLSAAVLAHQRGLKYVALEQDQVVATIQQTYQAGKYVFFNPADKAVTGGIKLDGVGATKEAMMGSWFDSMKSSGVKINEFEGCKTLKPEGGGFVIGTLQEKTKQEQKYKVRRVVLAIGNRGTPMKLRVSGEDLTFTTSGPAVLPSKCPNCGTARTGENKFCLECGKEYTRVPGPMIEDERVKFKLSDPNEYVGKHVVIVGAGNSAIEAAVDLAAYRTPDGAKITGWRDNTVSLVVRSDFKGDLKLGNKMLVYDCIDAGKIKAYFGRTIKELVPGECILMSARERDPKTAKEDARFQNDYIFALIGGEKPTKFLEGIGIQIG
jgi:thioredoxin reductase (NADPH)